MPLGTLTQVEAEERLHFWQQLLRLGDWKIRVELVRARAIDDELGRVHSNMMRDALILLMEPDDIPPYSSAHLANSDMEVNLVHELLHLRWKDVGWNDKTTPEGRAEEAAVEAIAQALVALERRNTLT